MIWLQFHANCTLNLHLFEIKAILQSHLAHSVLVASSLNSIDQASIKMRVSSVHDSLPILFQAQLCVKVELVWSSLQPVRKGREWMFITSDIWDQKILEWSLFRGMFFDRVLLLLTIQCRGQWEYRIWNLIIFTISGYLIF